MFFSFRSFFFRKFKGITTIIKRKAIPIPIINKWFRKRIACSYLENLRKKCLDSDFKILNFGSYVLTMLLYFVHRNALGNKHSENSKRDIFWTTVALNHYAVSHTYRCCATQIKIPLQTQLPIC